MPNKKRVVKTRKVSTPKKEHNFLFTESMIPEMSNGSGEVEFLSKYRQSAWQGYTTKSLPQTDEEPWRRTNLSKLKTESFSMPSVGESLAEAPSYLSNPIPAEESGGKINLTPSGSKIYLSAEYQEKGVVFTDLNTAAQTYPDLLEKVLGKIVSVDEDKLSSMTGAFSSSGVFLYVPKGVELTKLLSSSFWGPGSEKAYFSHILVYIDDQAKATFLHEWASLNEKAQSFHSGIVEVYVGKAAQFNFIELQSWGDNVWNFSRERAIIGRDSNLEWIIGSFGSHLTKNFSEIDLVGQGAVGKMSGIYFTDGDQHLDHDTQQNHNAPNTTSDLLFKGALKDNSRSIWQGMIYVAPNAQKTDGYQSNKNLILSSDARADSIPGLEILADDVRCTHGATVGKIDPNEVFYLGSRGIPVNEAENLIVEGFFDPVLQKIPYESLRDRIKSVILEKLK